MEIQEFLVERGSWRGRVGSLYEGSPRGARLVRHVELGRKNLTLHFVGDEPKSLKDGNVIACTGVQAGGAMALSAASTVSSTPAAIFTVAAGQKKILVLLVNFVENPGDKPYTVVDAEKAVFQDVNAFIQENSLGHVGVVGEVRGWYTIPLSFNLSLSIR